MIKTIYRCIVLLLLLNSNALLADSSTPLPLDKLKLPPGFSISIYAEKLPGARTLASSDSGVIFIGTRGEGKVYALIPAKNVNEKMRMITLLTGLNEPNGVAYYQGDLYVAETNRILKYEKVETHIDNMPAPIVLTDQLPNEKWHGYRVLHVGPDKKLYVAIGMPCNTCFHRNDQPLFGTIARMSLNGKDLEVYALGVRNSVGFDWHPKTHELWFTDNGQDFMGDDIPPDEINRATQKGQDFGFPYVYGDNILAPGYKPEIIKNLKFEPPAYKLPAHVAPLGLFFYTGMQFPPAYHYQPFVALHGSWNRSKKAGYEVIKLTLNGNQVTGTEPFITGWLQGEIAWGRPVDFLMLPEGSLLISDDFNGVIYQVSWKQ